MQKFSIARERQTPYMAHESKMDWTTEIVFLRLEPNGNVFWTIHPELASRWEHAEAEEKIAQTTMLMQNCYLVEATKEDA